MNRTAIPPAADPAAQKFLLLASLSQTSCKYLVACLYSIIINTLFGFSSARQFFFRRTKQAPEYAEQHTAFQDTLCRKSAKNTSNVWKRKSLEDGIILQASVSVCNVFDKNEKSEPKSYRNQVRISLFCLWATKKIFLLFLRMNSNPHHNYPVRKKPYFTRFFYCQSWTGGFRFPCFFFCVWEQGVLNSNQS